MEEGNVQKTIKEGSVAIKFADLGEEMEVSFIFTFSKVDAFPGEAANVFKSIVQVLRRELGVSLSECQ